MINKKEALGIYIHIPFCVKKCAYCDFLSGPCPEEGRRKYLQALRKEIAACGQIEGGSRPVKTVFFGGGTPSVLTGEQIEEIMETLAASFAVSETAEITLEANPGTLSREKLLGYRRAGINRLSLGLQSAKEEELKLLGRIHSFPEFLESFQMAREAGIENLNVDLMSGLPGQKIKSWEETLWKTAELEPEHISAYSLIVEEGTPFYERFGPSGKEAGLLPGEEEEREMYWRTKEVLSQAGYRQYEISNYARPGKECRHNLCYWTGGEYLGFGLGASSCVGGKRFSNTENWEEYLVHSAQPSRIRRLEEVLTEKRRMEEFCFLGLRLAAGISLKEFQEEFGIPFSEIYGAAEEKFCGLGLLKHQGDRLFLTEAGVDVSNQVLCEFLLEDD